MPSNDPNNAESLSAAGAQAQDFTVAANDLRKPASIAEAVRRLTAAVPAAKLHRVNEQAGVASVSLPLHSVDEARAHLGSDFSIEPNQSLSLIP